MRNKILLGLVATLLASAPTFAASKDDADPTPPDDSLLPKSGPAIVPVKPLADPLADAIDDEEDETPAPEKKDKPKAKSDDEDDDADLPSLSQVAQQKRELELKEAVDSALVKHALTRAQTSSQLLGVIAKNMSELGLDKYPSAVRVMSMLQTYAILNDGSQIDKSHLPALLAPLGEVIDSPGIGLIIDGFQAEFKGDEHAPDIGAVYNELVSASKLKKSSKISEQLAAQKFGDELKSIKSKAVKTALNKQKPTYEELQQQVVELTSQVRQLKKTVRQASVIIPRDVSSSSSRPAASPFGSFGGGGGGGGFSSSVLKPSSSRLVSHPTAHDDELEERDDAPLKPKGNKGQLHSSSSSSSKPLPVSNPFGVAKTGREFE